MLRLIGSMQRGFESLLAVAAISPSAKRIRGHCRVRIVEGSSFATLAKLGKEMKMIDQLEKKAMTMKQIVNNPANGLTLETVEIGGQYIYDNHQVTVIHKYRNEYIGLDIVLIDDKTRKTIKPVALSELGKPIPPIAEYIVDSILNSGVSDNCLKARALRFLVRTGLVEGFLSEEYNLSQWEARSSYEYIVDNMVEESYENPIPPQK